MDSQNERPYDDGGADDMNATLLLLCNVRPHLKKHRIGDFFLFGLHTVHAFFFLFPRHVVHIFPFFSRTMRFTHSSFSKVMRFVHSPFFELHAIMHSSFVEIHAVHASSFFKSYAIYTFFFTTFIAAFSHSLSEDPYGMSLARRSLFCWYCRNACV